MSANTELSQMKGASMVPHHTYTTRNNCSYYFVHFRITTGLKRTAYFVAALLPQVEGNGNNLNVQVEEVAAYEWLQAEEAMKRIGMKEMAETVKAAELFLEKMTQADC